MEPGLFGSMFEPIENLLHFLMEVLYNITDKLGFGSYGLAIILLTILVKVVLYPLTVKQIKSMKAMQEIQPELQKLQEKHKNNPQMLQMKMMELYKERGVNPMAGCLPLIIQMPILMGMYYALYNFDYGGAAPSFLWLPSLSETDPQYILPILAAATTLIQQKMTTLQQTQQTKMLMVVMPLFIGWLSLSFPAGLVLYWVTMNVVQIVQQWWIYRDGDANNEKGAA